MATSNNSNSENDSSIFDFLNWVLKSSCAFHFTEGYKYLVKIGKSGQSTVLNILQYSASGSASGNWMLRFDNAHPGTNFPHLNMRHRFTGINDPHIKLPPGSLTVAKYGGYVSKLLNGFRYFAFACDAYRICKALYKDYCLGIGTYGFGYTAKCLKPIVSEWVGALIGSKVLAVLGGLLLPGVGNLFGAIVGAFAGSLYGERLSSGMIQMVQDATVAW